ncbi:MAG: TadE/TadG family type IV pilus assembly protein, partial [Pseudomonadota bacterium]
MSAVQYTCQELAQPGGPPSGRDRKSIDHRSGFIARFSEDNKGTVAAIFAMLTPIVFGIVGGAVDTGRWLSARNTTLQAMDAAVLAAGRSIQINGSTNADAIAIARTYFDENKPENLKSEDVQFTIQDNGTLVVALSDSAIGTPFLSILGIEELPVKATSKALLAADGNAGTNIEISLMLDITGSMSPQSKIGALKDAAKDLIDIVVWDDQSNYSSRVALAPFATRINVGNAFYKAVTHVNPKGSNDKKTCIEERRQTAYLYVDDFPTYAKRFRNKNNTCTPQAAIMPLSNDKDALKARIDSMKTTGWTAGHLGIAWSWYMLSPNFNNVWPNSLGADADPYADLNATNTVTHGDAT